MSNKYLKTSDTSELINENMLTETNTPFFLQKILFYIKDN